MRVGNYPVLVPGFQTAAEYDITGGANDSFYEKNEGRTKEAILRKITRVLLIALFVLTIAVNAIANFIK